MTSRAATARIARASATGLLMLLPLQTLAAPASTPASTPALDPHAAVSGSTSNWSERGLFQAAYVTSPAPVRLLAFHSWTVTVTDAAGVAVEGAELAVTGAMSAHDHGLPTRPLVKDLGAGRYLVEGMKFHMPGQWLVLVRIRAGAEQDTVRFALDLR